MERGPGSWLQVLRGYQPRWGEVLVVAVLKRRSLLVLLSALIPTSLVFTEA